MPRVGGTLDVSAIRTALDDRGLSIVFVEGGGITISHFLEAGCIHRLQITVAPVIIGSQCVRRCRFGSPRRAGAKIRTQFLRSLVPDRESAFSTLLDLLPHLAAAPQASTATCRYD